ncbi:oligosaccharide flippase family protein, partial [Patescibacteria group bacterium]|nr:oligosaccharide flippase family protein [Patescibacteria group bacterium]
FLRPADYGIIAIILMITAVIDRLTSHGLGTALIQRRENMEPYLDAVWTLDVLKSLALASLIFIFAQPICLFFNIPEALPLVQTCGLLVVLANIGNVRQVYVFIALDFKKIFWRNALAQVAYVLTALGWVFLVSTNVWALLAGHFGRIFVAMAISYIIYPAWPRFSFNFLPLKKFFNYSKWIAGQNMLDYFNSLIDQFFVGRLLGAEKLGFYSKASDLASITRASLLSIISKVSFYAYNLVQDDLPKIQAGFVKSLNIMLMFSIPFSFLISVEGGAIISVLLGSNWLPLVEPLKILALANIFIAIYGITHPLFNSVGRPDINFKMTMLKLFLSVPIFYLSIKFWGTNGAALAVVVVAFILLLYSVWEARKILKISKEKILPSFYHIALSMAPIILLAIGLRPLIHSFGNNYLIFAWVLFLSMLYTLVFWLLGRWFPNGPRSTVEVIFSEVTSNWKS